MKRFTITLEEDLFDHLFERSEHNRRSMSQEIVFLLECALAAEVEGNLSIMRTLTMMVQGGMIPAHTGKAVPQRETSAESSSHP